MEKVTFKAIKNKAIKIATDLGYPEDILERIREAKTEIEIDILLTTARKRDKKKRNS